MLTAVGVLVYALGRTAYVSFYGQLGVEPEEVGLGYAEILIRISTRLLVNYLASLVLAVCVFLIVGSLLGLRERRSGKTAPALRGWMIFVLAAVLVLLNVGWQQNRLHKMIACGDPVRATRWAWILNPLEIQAEPVRVVSDADVREDLSEDDALTYLGRNGGTIVLYRRAQPKPTKAEPGTIVRVPEGRVFLSSPAAAPTHEFALEYIFSDLSDSCPSVG